MRNRHDGQWSEASVIGPGTRGAGTGRLFPKGLSHRHTCRYSAVSRPWGCSCKPDLPILEVVVTWSPPVERGHLSTRNCSVENLGYRVERAAILHSGVHLSSPTKQHRTSGNNTLLHFAHHGQIPGCREHCRRCRHHDSESEPAQTTQKWRVRPLTHHLGNAGQRNDEENQRRRPHHIDNKL